MKSMWGTSLSLGRRTGLSTEMTHQGLSSLQRKFYCSAIVPEEESHEKLVTLTAFPSPESSVHLPGFPVIPGDPGINSTVSSSLIC